MSYQYVKQSDNTVWHINELRAEHKNVSIPEGGDMSHLGYALLITTPRPTPLERHSVQEMPPVNNVQTWAQIAFTIDEIKSQLTAAVQEHLDAEAQTKGYDNIVSACSYAGAPNPFQVESMAFITWRGEVWAACYAIMAEVEAGTRAIPAAEELIAELPGF